MLAASPFKAFASLVLMALTFAATAQKTGSAANPYVLNPTPTTVVWGYYWSETPPVLHIQSGDYVRVRTVLTSNPERLEAAGVPPAQVEKELRDVKAVKERGPGVMYSPARFLSMMRHRAIYSRCGSIPSTWLFPMVTMRSARRGFYPTRSLAGKCGSSTSIKIKCSDTSPME